MYSVALRLFTISDTTRPAPTLISLVRAIVTKSANTLLGHLVTMVMDGHATEEPNRALFKRNVPERVLTKIPKEWNYTALESRGHGTPTKRKHRPGCCIFKFDCKLVDVSQK